MIYLTFSKPMAYRYRKEFPDSYEIDIELFAALGVKSIEVQTEAEYLAERRAVEDE